MECCRIKTKSTAVWIINRKPIDSITVLMTHCVSEFVPCMVWRWRMKALWDHGVGLKYKWDRLLLECASRGLGQDYCQKLCTITRFHIAEFISCERKKIFIYLKQVFDSKWCYCFPTCSATERNYIRYCSQTFHPLISYLVFYPISLTQ